MKISIPLLFLQFLCISFFCSISASTASVELGEWLHPATSSERKKAIQKLVLHVTSLNKFDLNNFGSHPGILQAGKHTAYARDHEVALWALATEYAAASSGMNFADIGSGLGTLGLLAPFISDGSKPMKITLVEGCEAYFCIFDESLTRIKVMHPPGVTFRKITCMVGGFLKLEDIPEERGPLAEERNTFNAITCMNVLPLMSDVEQAHAIRDMRRLLKENGILVASCVACNAGIFTKDITPMPGRYMAKVSIILEKSGVDNTIKEFIPLSDSDEIDYTPQAYYVLEGDVYTEKSCAAFNVSRSRNDRVLQIRTSY